MQIMERAPRKIEASKKIQLAATTDDFKILVADDSAIYRALLKDTLRSEQYSVMYAKSGREALDLFAEHRPNLVITDWMMPDLTGIELCQRIRNESQNSYTYVIILTALREKHEVIKGLTAGADDFLTKPFDSNELLARVGVGRRVVDLHKQLEAKSRLLEELAHTDSLTGLPNRRAIEVWATRELASAARHDFSFWAVLADLDNFKSLNDTHGHEAGDTVLQRFAKIVQAGTRSADICARIGGEEFLIVLTHSNQEGAKLAVERIRENMSTEKFKFGKHEIVVTASFGMASYSRHQAQTLNRLIAQADVALYSSKRLGRNRVEIANTELNAVAN